MVDLASLDSDTRLRRVQRRLVRRRERYVGCTLLRWSVLALTLSLALAWTAARWLGL